jgi:hypothetical protein
MLQALLLVALTCPLRDAPASYGEHGDIAELATLRDVDASMVFHVDELGVGRARTRLRWANDSHGPAAAGHTFSADDARPVVVTRARLGARAVDAAWVAYDDADVKWFEFEQALRLGVDDDLAHTARYIEPRVGLRVSVDRLDTRAPRIEVAGACSARAPEAEVEFLVDGEAIEGAWRFTLPAPFAHTRLRVDAGARQVHIDGRRTRDDTRRFASTRIDDDSPEPIVVIVERSEHGAGGEGGEGVFARGHTAAFTSSTAQTFTLAHLAVDVPDALEPIPPALRIVFVVDTSVSMGEAGLARALELLREILDAAPDDLGWALIGSARRPELLVPPWRGKHARFLPAPPLQNGSNLVDAVQLAARIAADAQPGSGRVIVLSDLHQAAHDEPRLPVAIAARGRDVRRAGAGSAPLVHLVQLAGARESDDAARLDYERVDDESALTDAVHKTGGVMLETWPVDTFDAQSAPPLARHLITPLSIDEPRILLDGVDVQMRARHISTSDAPTRDLDELPLRLPVGRGLRTAWLLDGQATHIALVGRIWGRKLTLPLRSNRRARHLAHGQAVNANFGDELNDEEVHAITQATPFVSRMTSLLDVPAWRPAAGDVLRVYSVGVGCTGSSVSSCGGVRFGQGRPGLRTIPDAAHVSNS